MEGQSSISIEIQGHKVFEFVVHCSSFSFTLMVKGERCTGDRV